jgi:AraC-like DNA-binding protein
VLKILPIASGIGWPRVFCGLRGDLGCLAAHAKAAGYRADELARRFGVSSRTMRREFKASLGLSLKKWLADLRALEVRRRLLGNESIQEIASSVGFSHPKELAREFQSIYQVTPSEYRSREQQRSEIGSRKPEAGADEAGRFSLS